jgi:hypothetical protein
MRYTLLFRIINNIHFYFYDRNIDLIDACLIKKIINKDVTRIKLTSIIYLL